MHNNYCQLNQPKKIQFLFCETSEKYYVDRYFRGTLIETPINFEKVVLKVSTDNTTRHTLIIIICRHIYLQNKN